MKKLIFPLLVSFVFIFEGIMVSIWNAELYMNGNIPVPHFLFLILVFYAIYCNKSIAIYYSIIFGMLFDITYTEVLGVYSFGLPIIVFLIAQTMKVIQNYLPLAMIFSIVGVVILEYYVYFLYILVNVSKMEHAFFFQNRLIPTLLLNSIFIVVVGFFIKKLFLYLQKKEEE